MTVLADPAGNELCAVVAHRTPGTGPGVVRRTAR